MPKFTIYVSEGDLRNGAVKKTANQWLCDHIVRGPSYSIRHLGRLPEPVTVVATQPDERTQFSVVYKRVGDLIRGLAAAPIITAVRWKSAFLGPHALLALNLAFRTPAARRGGHSIVRKFYENRGAAGPFLRGDWPDLLAYLEIRPVARVKKITPAAPASLAPITPSESAPSNARHYVQSKIGHKQHLERGSGSGKARLNRGRR